MAATALVILLCFCCFCMRCCAQLALWQGGGKAGSTRAASLRRGNAANGPMRKWKQRHMRVPSAPEEEDEVGIGEALPVPAGVVEL